MKQALEFGGEHSSFVRDVCYEVQRLLQKNVLHTSHVKYTKISVKNEKSIFP